MFILTILYDLVFFIFRLPDGVKPQKWYSVGVVKTKDNMKLSLNGDSLTLKTLVSFNVKIDAC